MTFSVGSVFPGRNNTHEDRFTEAEIIAKSPDIQVGGVWQPKNCTAQHKVAVIIPFRDRQSHLTVLLAHIHPIMQRQLLKYQIFVVEQKGNDTFNKARIMNIGFSYVTNTSKWDCVIFHDVDLIPENDLNMYACPKQPRHLSPAIDEFGYTNPYDLLVGGVLAMRIEHFRKINGYSNLYWGWGGEDDDLAYRIQNQKLKITRPTDSIGRYNMIKHKKRERAPERHELLNHAIKRYLRDGVNSLTSLKWEITAVTNHSLYQHIMIDIGPPPKQ